MESQVRFISGIENSEIFYLHCSEVITEEKVLDFFMKDKLSRDFNLTLAAFFLYTHECAHDNISGSIF